MEAAKALALSMGMNDHGPLHAQRVYAIVGRLCALVKLSPYEQDLVRAAALLHDIGMARDRAHHNDLSAALVRQLSEEKKLPFSPEEAGVVSTLCKWHRGTYDSEAVDQELKVRTGMLSSLLRIADALDLDYRRADNYLRQKPVIDHVHPGQEQHHISVQNIIGIRLHATRTDTEVQLFIDKIGNASLQLTRLVDELVGTPIAWPVKLIPIRSGSQGRHELKAIQEAVVFSYCNAHGIVQTGISKHALDMSGFSTTVVCDNNRTGHPPSFWEMTISKWDFSNTRLVAILGLDLPENVQQLVDLVQRYPKCRWIYATPLEQPSEKMATLIDAGVEILLGDARFLFAGDALSEQAVQWTKIAGLCNADDWLTSIGGFSKDEFQAARGLRFELLKLFTSKADCNYYEELVNKVASGKLTPFLSLESNWRSTLENQLPNINRQGRVLIMKGSSIPGRFVYDLAHLAIEKQGGLPWEQNEFSTPYVIFRRPIKDGLERVLFLSRFSRIENTVPVKYFVPSSDNQYGSGATIWQTYQTRSAADQAINTTIRNINQFFKCED